MDSRRILRRPDAPSFLESLDKKRPCRVLDLLAEVFKPDMTPRADGKVTKAYKACTTLQAYIADPFRLCCCDAGPQATGQGRPSLDSTIKERDRWDKFVWIDNQ